jgi:subtilisin family serine protease
VLGGGLRYSVRRGSIPFPGDGPEVVAVGAVGADGHRLAYSSCGPNSPRPKPELVAPVPFPSLWRSRPFAGTSAAAPQAAALAVLLWSRHPDWTPLQVRATLCSAARHAGTTRHNCDTGYGQIHLP